VVYCIGIGPNFKLGIIRLYIIFAPAVAVFGSCALLEAIFQEDTLWRVIGTEVILESAQDDGVVRTLGIASALLATYAFVPYVRDVLARRTEPQNACWLIWSVLSSIALA
jgi:hypothetical protein